MGEPPACAVTRGPSSCGPAFGTVRLLTPCLTGCLKSRYSDVFQPVSWRPGGLLDKYFNILNMLSTICRLLVHWTEKKMVVFHCWASPVPACAAPTTMRRNRAPPGFGRRPVSRRCESRGERTITEEEAESSCGIGRAGRWANVSGWLDGWQGGRWK